VDYAKALWELEQIKRLKSRYYRLQDQNRWEEWEELFTEDCEIADPQDAAIVLRGPKAVADRTSSLVGTFSRAHRGTMPDLELIDDRTARGTWALQCASLHALEGGATFTFIFGYYTDESRKDDDGQWRIHRMRYDNDMSILGDRAPPIKLLKQ
jgi:hypothetical protein